MTKNEDISKPFKVIERQTLEVENVVEKNKYFTILFFSQLYTQLDTCQKFHPYTCDANRVVRLQDRLSEDMRMPEGRVVLFTHVQLQQWTHVQQHSCTSRQSRFRQ